MGTLNLRLSRWAERLPSLRPSLANLRGWAVPLALLLGLEALVRSGILPAHQMPAPSQVAQTLYLLAQCEVWPRGRRPADFNAPVQSDRPVLLLSGQLDPVTPPRHGEAIARALPNVRHFVAPHLGHGVSGQGCAPDLIGRFGANPVAAFVPG